MNDFASDDFLTKNIRVRPVSGKTIDDATKTDVINRNMVTDGEQDEDNFNKMVNLDMEE